MVELVSESLYLEEAVIVQEEVKVDQGEERQLLRAGYFVLPNRPVQLVADATSISGESEANTRDSL
jgi:hypothetical protein